MRKRSSALLLALVLAAGAVLRGGVVEAAELGPTVIAEISSLLVAFPWEPVPSEVPGVGVDEDAVEWRSVLSVTVDQPLGERLTLNLAGHLAYDTGADHAEWANPLLHRDNYDPAYAAITAANVTRYGDAVDVRVGKAALPLGVATLYSPVDERYGAVNRADPVHPLELGVWQTRATWYVGDDALSYTLLPLWERDAVPARESRWLGGARPEEFLLVGLAPGTPVETDQPSLAPRDWGHLLEYRGVRAGYDVFGAIHYGPSRFPVLRRPEPTAVASVRFPSTLAASGGVVLTRGPWRLATETVAQFAPAGRDQDYLRGIVEVERRETALAQRLGLTEIAPALGFVADIVLDSQSDADYVQSSEPARPLRNSLLGRIAVQVNPDLKVELGGSVALDRAERSWAAGIEYRLDDNRRVLLGLRGFGGDDDTYFGRWRDNDLIETGFVWTF